MNNNKLKEITHYSDYSCVLVEFFHLPDKRDFLKPKEKRVFTVFGRFPAMLSAMHEATPKRGWPGRFFENPRWLQKGDNANGTTYSGRFELSFKQAYFLLHMDYCCKTECAFLKIYG